MRLFEVETLDNYNIVSYNSNELPDNIIYDVFNILLENNQITAMEFHKFKNKIYEAVIAFDQDNNIIGFRSIKIPRELYINKIFTKAGVSELIDYNLLELGSLFVKPNYRGYGLASKMLKMIMEERGYINSPMFATTMSVNHKVDNMLKKYNFTSIGEPYESNLGNGLIVLYINY